MSISSFLAPLIPHPLMDYSAFPFEKRVLWRVGLATKTWNVLARQETYKHLFIYLELGRNCCFASSFGLVECFTLSMEVLKITSTLFFVIGLGIPKYFKNKVSLLFVSVIMAVIFFYIGLGYEILNFIVDGNIRILSLGFVCFNLVAFFIGSWLSCIVYELFMEFKS